MMQSLVVTFVGNDRAGIVESISRIVTHHQGSWVESRLANLSGKFAGVLRITLPEQNMNEFIEELNSSLRDLEIQVSRVESSVAEVIAPETLQLELVGQDRPGIVHRISAVLLQQGATVDDMHSEVVEASMSGEHLFKAVFKIHLQNPQVSRDKLKLALEALADELIVDLQWI